MRVSSRVCLKASVFAVPLVALVAVSCGGPEPTPRNRNEGSSGSTGTSASGGAGGTSTGVGGSTAPGTGMGGGTNPANGGAATMAGSGGAGGTVAPGNGGAPPTNGGTAGTPPVGNGGTDPMGGAGPVAGAGGDSAGMTGTGGTPPAGNDPPGYWRSGDWFGCTWTGIDMLQNSTTKNTPQDFTNQPAGGPYCVSGTVHNDYEAVALLGFNLAEPAEGADCSYKPVDPTAPGPPAVMLKNAGATGIAVNFSKKIASTLRVQIQGPNGASDENDRWCYTITDPAGPILAEFDDFNTKCWDGTGNKYTGEPISAVVFLVPGAEAPTEFDYCVNGFAVGDSPDDAPEGGGPVGPVTGKIGGPGSRDLDFQRVKIKAGGKSYIIQNNNWGNPEGTDQTIEYRDNSFTIVGATGAGAGGGVPASFPSIYIGANGDTQGGLFSTSSDDNLPKQISTIQSIQTKFKYNRASGNYNAAYDVWFASSPPNAPYEDAISGFVMVWLYDPPQNEPIGGSPLPEQANIAGHNWQVWVGPRGGSRANANAPVVSYVATQTLMELQFDLLDFIKDAAKHGIQPSWYLTDVFAGFEIWDGNGTQGLAVEEFTAVVQ